MAGHHARGAHHGLGRPAGLAANVGVALLLYAWRDGDANMRGVWLCTRNDALSNVAVMLAALGCLARAATGPTWWWPG